MSDLKVRVFKHDGPEPTTTVTIPGTVLRIAASLIPKRATSALRDEDIDLEEIVRLSENPDAKGILVEVEDHEKNERVVIALE